MTAIHDLRQLSELSQRVGLAARAGITFGGVRDLYSALGYSRDIRPLDYRDRYRRNGIAARIIEALPQATWRAGCALIEDEDPEVDTAFETAWTELDRRLGVWAAFRRVDVLAGLGRYAVLLLGAPGALDTPLPARLSPKQLVYLASYSEEDARVDAIDEDTTSERFGLPLRYSLTIRTASAGASSAATTRNVHWSRLIHVVDGKLDDRVYGIPRLERIWNYLDDLEKVVGAGAEAFWRRAHQGVHVNIDKDLEVNPAEAKKIEEAADDLIHGFRRIIGTRGATLDVLGSDVANFNQPVDAIITLIAGATAIPKRILVGTERGELASTQDRTSWDELISDRRSQYAEPELLRPFVDLLIARGALPTPKQYSVLWPDLAQLTEAERADIASKWAGLNSKETVVTANEIRDRVLDLDPLPEEEEVVVEDEDEDGDEEPDDDEPEPTEPAE